MRIADTLLSNLDGKDFSSHFLRYSCATHLL